MTELNPTPPHQRFKILLIGDSCTDVYQYGTVDRISPEAPVPVFKHLYSEEKSGMVFNVKKNLENFPVDVTLYTDLPSRKIRLIDKKTKQHILRIDQDTYSKEPYLLTEDVNEYDAVIVSDYEKGFITYDLFEQLKQLYTGPVYVDTKKKDLAKLNPFIVKVNEQERNECISVCDNLITTLGSNGALYNNVVYKTKDVEIADVCGAGDTFLASLAYFHLLTGRLDLAIPFANKAAAVTVQHFGTYAPTMKEFL